MNIRSFLATCILCCLSPTFAFAQEDMAGSSDYPNFPRISGSTIAGYSPSAFDEAPYLEGTHDDLTLRYATGEVTKILYLPPLDHSPSSALLNYQKAFEELGEFELFYTCKRGTCDEEMGGDFIWHKENRFDSTLKAPSTYFFTYKQNRVKQVYLSGKITADTGAYIVSAYAAQAPKAKGDFKGGQTVVVLQIVKIESFEADLEVVAAEKIDAEIVKSGHVALYGLFFETDSDDLMATSKPALDEVAGFLKSSPDVNVYVVGHTDNEGDVAYNQALSMRRASSISAHLTDEYGIDASRITPLGAGLAAPVSTNKTAEGRALNRRVELVER